jgi:acyl-CoA synthetase (NDP forming)
VTISISLKKTHLTVQQQPDTWKVTILTKGQMMKYCNKEKRHCSVDRTQVTTQDTNHQLSAKTCPETKHNNNVLRLQDLTNLSLNSMQQLWAGKVRSILE